MSGEEGEDVGGPDYVNLSFAGCINLRLAASPSATFTPERRPTAKSTPAAESNADVRMLQEEK